MSDQNPPQNPGERAPQYPPPAPPQAPAGATPPPSYSAAPPPPAAYGTAPNAPVPGRTLGIVAFVLSFFVQLVALVLGIVALVQSKKAGASNGWAIAAIVVSAVLLVIGVIVVVGIVVTAVAGFGVVCGELGPGTHVLDDGTTITCG